MTVHPRFGLELELCTAAGATRDDVATALAAAIGGRVLFGLKHLVDGELAPGRPRCVLRPACRVVDSAGDWYADLVDDPTLRDFSGASSIDDGDRAIVLDDTRLAKWLEAGAFSPDADVAARLQPLLDTFHAHVEHDRVVDRWGQVLAVLEPSSSSFRRACEIVTAPLPRDALDDVVAAALAAAATAGCTIPRTAALHVHLDAAPWQDAARLARLITGWNVAREAHLDALRTNRACLRLGPFPPLVERVAREALAASSPLPWSTFAAGLAMAGVHKACDVNLKGVIDRHPVQPTLELRCLPMSLAPGDVVAGVDVGVTLLERLAA